jgi:hypothetical protein
MPLLDRPWPVAPRPFADEPLGGWLGRVAARYRLGVRQLCEAYGLDTGTTDSGMGWLLLPPQPARNIDALAMLARLDVRTLESMRTPVQWPLARRQAAYCPRCLFLNDLDVTSPCWSLNWLDPAATWCARHARPLESVAAGKLRHCRNFDAVVQTIGRRETLQRALKLAHVGRLSTARMPRQVIDRPSPYAVE